jgi:hypothetical protein
LTNRPFRTHSHHMNDALDRRLPDDHYDHYL